MTLIREANAVLQADAYHDVRRSADGEIEMIDSEGRVIITFSPTISIYDLVGVSMLYSESWLDIHNASERETFNGIYKAVQDLRAEHGSSLEAPHIEAMLEETKRWHEFCDKEREDEAEAHRKTHEAHLKRQTKNEKRKKAAKHH